MYRPDFARTDLSRLDKKDLHFLMSHFPVPGRSYEDIGHVINTLPNTLESMLESQFVYDVIFNDKERFIEISPFLFFSVILRKTLIEDRSPRNRRVINYLANLLSLFVHKERVYKTSIGDDREQEYIVDLIEEASNASADRQFVIYAHIGNYCLYTSGILSRWLNHRYKFKRQLVNADYYIAQGRSFYKQAASHRLAERYGLDSVLFQLSVLFEEYQKALRQLSHTYLMSH